MPEINEEEFELLDFSFNTVCGVHGALTAIVKNVSGYEQVVKIRTATVNGVACKIVSVKVDGEVVEHGANVEPGKIVEIVVKVELPPQAAEAIKNGKTFEEKKLDLGFINYRSSDASSGSVIRVRTPDGKVPA